MPLTSRTSTHAVTGRRAIVSRLSRRTGAEMSTKADRLHAAPETIKQRNDPLLASPPEREVLTALKESAELADSLNALLYEGGEDKPASTPTNQEWLWLWRSQSMSTALATQLRAAIAKAESAP